MVEGRKEHMRPPHDSPLVPNYVETEANSANIWYQIVTWSDREQRWYPFAGTGREIYNNLSDAKYHYGLICGWNKHMHFGIAKVNMFPDMGTTMPAEKAEVVCPNCKEANVTCACMRNKCPQCGQSVGNITFTLCDTCWKEKHKEKR